MAPTTEFELSAPWAPLERLIAELERRLRTQEEHGRELRRVLVAGGYLPADR